MLISFNFNRFYLSIVILQAREILMVCTLHNLIHSPPFLTLIDAYYFILFDYRKNPTFNLFDVP